MNCILGDEMGLGKTLQVPPFPPTTPYRYSCRTLLQTLSLLAYVKEHAHGTSLALERRLYAYHLNSLGAASDPHLIICPLSVLSSWLNASARAHLPAVFNLTRIYQEIARWVPSFRALRFHGQASERTRLKNSIRDRESDFDICVTTYDSFVVEHGWFKSKRWNYCVLDEGHKIKNSDTGVASKLQGIGASRRLSK